MKLKQQEKCTSPENIRSMSLMRTSNQRRTKKEKVFLKNIHNFEND